MVLPELEPEPETEKKHHRKEKDRKKDRDRKERDREKDRDSKERDRDREWDRKKDRDSKERDRGRDREHEKDGNNRERERTRDRDIEKREKEKDREKDRGRDREDRDRDRDKEQLKDKERDRSKDREKDRDHDHNHERDRFRGRDQVADKIRHQDWDKYRDRERERDKLKEKDRARTEKDHVKERGQDRDRERGKDKEYDHDRDREKKERDKDWDCDKGREDKEQERDWDRHRDKERVKEREMKNDRGTEKNRERFDKEKDKRKERDVPNREAEKDKEQEQAKERVRDWEHEHEKEMTKEWERSNKAAQKHHYAEGISGRNEECEIAHVMEVKSSKREEGEYIQDASAISGQSYQKQHCEDNRKDAGNEIANWVNKSRKLEGQKKIEERIKAARMARLLAEQDNEKAIDSDDDERDDAYNSKNLAGLKVLHGVDKVMEGAAVVLTLKDKNILAGDDVNDEVDELESLEIAQQRARDEAYKAAKKQPGGYQDKFQNDINGIRTILPQYDDVIQEAGVTLDETGGLDEVSRKKLEELKLKLGGMSGRFYESITGGASVASDFFTQEEMLQFNKPKKKKKLRKKEVLDLDALEAEAKVEGLGASDLGSRKSNVRNVAKQEEEKAAEESRRSAYLNAYTKAVEHSKRLQTQVFSDRLEIDVGEGVVFGSEEDAELSRSLEKARKAALKKQTESVGSYRGPESVAAVIKEFTANNCEQKGSLGDNAEEEKGGVIFTEMEEFCRSLQLDEILAKRPVVNDAFGSEETEGTIEEEHPVILHGGWMEVKEPQTTEMHVEEKDDEVDDDGAIKEISIGKGLAGALQLLKERGSLKDTIDWGGRNMDKKKSKLVGIVDQEEKFRNREILLDRVDEFGRTMTPKECFRKLSHKFHGKGPGKLKLEKRMKQYHDEMKLKQMSSGDTPLMSMEKMREAQAKMHTPYIVISGHIKPGQTSDPRSGFATVEKDFIGSLTPMIGDKKVEHFLGIKRKPESGSMGPPPSKKPNTEL